MWGTRTLAPALRKTFRALWVKGDGNCFWRSVSRVLWGCDEYWPQLKLVVLGWAFANVELLLGERVPSCLEGSQCFDEDIYEKHRRSLLDAQDSDQRRAAFAAILREHIARFCLDRAWGGPVCAIFVAERLGVVTKMIDPLDLLSRKRQDAQLSEVVRVENNHAGDHRLSWQYIPSSKESKCVHVCGFGGGNKYVVEEIAIVSTASSYGLIKHGSLTDTDVIKADSNLPNELDHFAALVPCAPHVRPPFPLFKAAPPLHPQNVSYVMQRDSCCRTPAPLIAS